MGYKLIAIDMDGTLLNSRNEISERNRKILHRAKEEGVHVILCTGRILHSALHYGQVMALGEPVIACNGAIVSSGDGDNILYHRPMDIKSIKGLIELAEKNEIYYHFYDKDTFYTEEVRNEVIEFYASSGDRFGGHRINIEGLDDPIKFLNSRKPKIYKLVFMDDNRDRLRALRSKLDGMEGVDISSSWNNNIEVMASGVSKGSGLRYLIQSLGIDRTELMVIGDNENDIAMFQMAGLSVAMGNGEPIVKESADVITDTNDEDGVAKAIEKYVLNV